MTPDSEQKHSEPKAPIPTTPAIIERPRSFKLGLGIGAIALLLIGFFAGHAVEQMRLRHFIGWRNNYHRNFFGPSPFHSGPDAFGPPSHFRAHSLFGNVLAVEENKLTVQDRDGVEQSVVLTDQTTFRRDGSTASESDLKVDQQIAVFGRPNDEGQITATLIRIFEDNENPLP